MKNNPSISLLLICITLLTISSNLISADSPKIVKAFHLQGDGIILDGSLNDAIWKVVNFTSGFTQRDPLEGDEPTEKTEFALLYDDQFLYIGIKAYDSEPEKIQSILSRRDEETPSDWLCVSLDSYGDFRTAFEFWLNPQGVKRDVRWNDDTNQDVDWDAIWGGQTEKQDDGWSAEFKIPFRELRFGGKENESWGLQVYRHISRKNEDNYWSFWSKDETGYVRHFGRLAGLENLPRQRRIYISPYTTSQYSVSPLYKNALHPENYNINNLAGADIKVGVGNNLTLDITINPDFGQVETDPSEFNLSAFESYFPEKRPFFVEGSNIFRFNLGLGDNDNSSNTLFYSRQIGRSPHYSPKIDDDDFIETPGNSSILAAGKLSGKTGNGWSIGILDAVTAKEQAIIRSLNGSSYNETVEPATNYFVSRFQKDLHKGRTTFGGIITATNRQLNENHLKFLRSDSYSGGIDFSHLFADDSYQIEGTISATHVLGSTDAILNTQTSSIHYFQRPGAQHLKVDSSATSLTGYSHKLAFSKVKGEHWRGAFGEWTYSPGFEANDLGYHRNVDSRVGFIWVQYREDDPAKIIRRWMLNYNLWGSSTTGNEMVGIGGNINGNLTLMNYWQGGMGINYNGPKLHTTALWGGPAMIQDSQGNIWLWISSDRRKELAIQTGGGFGGSWESGMNWLGVGPEVTWRFTDYITLSLSTQINKLFDTWATWRNYGQIKDQQTGELQYIMAELDQTTISTTLRLDLTISPTLSIQYYGSPFISAGKYKNDKLVLTDKALADNYDDRFHTFTGEEINYDSVSYTYDTDGDGVTNFELGNRDFNFKKFNSNLVIRWEYITGSTIYVVWSQGIIDYNRNGDFSFDKDIKTLFNSKGENIFLIKVSYLMNL